MKKLTVILFAFVAFLFTSLSASAENTTGNVDVWAYSNIQTKTIEANLRWFDNDSGNYIQTYLSWDTIPNSYRFIDSSSWGVKYYNKEGKVSFLITPYSPCKLYYVRFEFVDGKSGKRSQLNYFEETPGNKKPEITSIHFNQIGFTFASFTFSTSLYCNNANYEISCGEWGKLPFFNRSGSLWGGTASFQQEVYGLDPNTELVLKIRVFNYIGDTTLEVVFGTLSNLPPVVESVSSVVTGNQSVTVLANIDPKHTSEVEARIEYGTTIDLGEITVWNPAQIKGSYSFPLENLKPNTIYFWRPVARNDFGQDEGQTKMFKTNQFATAITEITSDDLMQVSSCPAGIRIYPEKDAVVEIYSITGQKILVANINGGEAQIFSSLTPGVYIVKSSIEGFTITKKAMVN